ncbi:hypothetical protein P5673_023235 [Acropora cervicornis]|uniref:Uncharacterized protein n=1 Tax=Acropora cervicornis TaxID=6130 RepID=A0AAD9Q5V4_ACRCE|nr:hypothetical protein P5673_023235 [Acropora cervicornis]
MANQVKYEEGASGIEVIQTELDILLEEIIEKEKDAKQRLELGVGDKKKKDENEELSAEDIRKQAMERMSQTAKRKEEEGSGDSSGVKKKKNRRSSNDLFQYFEEKLSKEYAFKPEKLALQTNRNEREHYSSRMK